MNLISDAWLSVIRASGKDKIAPWQIAERDDPVMELNAPRPDFQGALYQFLIGLLQTCFAPADHEEWLEYWGSPPEERVLQGRFEALRSAFDLECVDEFPAPPAFMQDAYLAAEERKEITALLIEAPGGKTIKENLDHFVKRDNVVNMCLSCAAAALFTLQINAPSGGVGHRVGVRGGGPLTTLVRSEGETTLWSKLWLNVLEADRYVDSIQKPSADVFPWMGEVRTSDKGLETRPSDVHQLQAYWGMPRRIRLLSTGAIQGQCSLCGEQDRALIKEYVTRNYGVNYAGEWVHPLTPYRFDPQKEKPPLSIKGQKGGLGYRHWVALTIAHSEEGDHAAKIARAYMELRFRDIRAQRIARLWCFGYDMDNMKARCWYDHTLPLFRLDETQQENVLSWASELIDAAEDVAASLQKQTKAAWFRRPGDSKGDMGVISEEFRQRSETDFYELLRRLATLPGDQRLIPPDICDTWVKKLQTLAYELFDEWALEGPAEDLDMKRIITARLELTKKLNTSKSMKELIAKTGKRKGVANATDTTVPVP